MKIIKVELTLQREDGNYLRRMLTGEGAQQFDKWMEDACHAEGIPANPSLNEMGWENEWLLAEEVEL